MKRTLFHCLLFGLLYLGAHPAPAFHLHDLTRTISPAARATIQASRSNSLARVAEQAEPAKRLLQGAIEAPRLRQEFSKYLNQAEADLKAAAEREAKLQEENAQLTNSEEIFSTSTITLLLTTVLGAITTLRSWKSGKLENQKTELEIAKLKVELQQLQSKGVPGTA